MSELKYKQRQLFVNKYMLKYEHSMTVAKMLATYSSMLKIRTVF